MTIKPFQIAFVLTLAASATPTRLAVAEPLYSQPWQLQPVTTDNVIRVDSAAAVFNDAHGNLDLAESTVLAARYQMTSHWAPTLRLAFVGNNAPGAARDGSSFVNPVAGATYTRSMGDYKLALSWATTIPVGTGGGDDPDPRVAKTNAASSTARPADSAMFDVNYVTESVGADLAYVNHGFTAQGEATLLQSVRVRGSNSAGGTDRFRTGSNVGLHLGYYVGSHFSLGADLHYQRWLSHPTTLDAMTGAHVPISDANMDVVSIAVGVRLHLGVGNHAHIHPGISFTRGVDARGLDAPLITDQANAIQLDLPVMF